MKSKVKYLILAVTIFAVVLCGCGSEPDARDVYEDYLEMAKTDLGAAISKYCYYERSDVFHMVWDTKEYMVSYELLDWEQINDNLWTAKGIYVSSLDGEPLEIRNFIGLFNGTYKIMVSIEEVPDFLTDGLDLEKYYQERTDPEDGSIMYF